MIAAAEFDRLADLPLDDPAGDMTPYRDLSKARVRAAKSSVSTSMTSFSGPMA
jgi:hypothetical protein